VSEAHRVAIVGCGGVSDMHFRGYAAHQDRVTVVAACDPVEACRDRVEHAHGVSRTFATVAELLDSADFDTAVVCTPSVVRLDVVRSLALANKHVLVEKPMADSLDEAREIVEICDEAGVHLAVNQNFRDHYAFGLAREAIEAGETGRVLGIEHRELTFRLVQGWRAEARHHALAVMGVHWLDGFRQLLPGDADWLSARTWSSPAAPAAGETDAFVQLHFGEASVNYVQSFSSHVESVETIVIGEASTLRLTYDTLELAAAGGRRELRPNPYAGPGKPESTYRSLERLLDAVDAGSEATNSGADNLKTLSLLAAAYQSAATDRPVHLKNGLL
jgi:predicted dehydrogenase